MEKSDARLLALIQKGASIQKIEKVFKNDSELKSRISILLYNPKTEESLIWRDKPTSKYVLTGNGEKALRDYRDREVGMSIRYWITTSISIGAILISIVVLLAQLRILPLPQLR